MVIVDSTEARFQGNWQTSSFQRNSYGQTYRVTDRMSYSTDPRVAQWRPSLPSAGKYTVSIWLPDGGEDRATAVTYRLHHAGQVSEFLVNQAVLGGQWKRLGRGSHLFHGSGEEFLELRVADIAASLPRSALYVQADAARFASDPAPPTEAPRINSVIEAPNFVEISWTTTSVSDAYLISRGNEAGSMTVIAEVTGTTYLDLDVEHGFSYNYSVAGVNDAGVGPVAFVTAATSKSAPLQMVQGLTVRTVRGAPELSWQPTRAATAYLVERSKKSGGPFFTIAQVTGTKFVDFLAFGVAHYRVRSVNAYGNSALSSWQVNWRG
ncbi:UNVERIFIED_ORG: hypothetical protein ABIB19_003593 [Arthrobacter sp. UYEF10]